MQYNAIIVPVAERSPGPESGREVVKNGGMLAAAGEKYSAVMGVIHHPSPRVDQLAARTSTRTSRRSLAEPL